MISICNDWGFTRQWFDGFASGEGQTQSVRLPHTARELPLHYADHESYQMVCGYRKLLDLGPELQGKRIFLQFDGAAHIATVYMNGREVAHHRCGYTGFRAEVTDAVVLGSKNILAVKLDTTENPLVPPFGFVIDYLTYGGLYREVWLDIREESYISDVFVTTPTTESVHVEAAVENAEGCVLEVEITKGGHTIAKDTFLPGESLTLPCPGVKPWNTVRPVRYICRVTLKRGDTVLDSQKVRFGFRTAEFKADGFYLNGKKVFLYRDSDNRDVELQVPNGTLCDEFYEVLDALYVNSKVVEDIGLIKNRKRAMSEAKNCNYENTEFFKDMARFNLLTLLDIPEGMEKPKACDGTQKALEEIKNA